MSITNPYTLEQLKAAISANDYNAELMLQHAMLLLEARGELSAPGMAELVAVCPTCGMDEPYTGSCGTSDSDTKALCKGRISPVPSAPDQLAALYAELDTLKWAGKGLGWDLAIGAVRRHIGTMLATRKGSA